jgi:phosphate transport system substrate-binding protein
VQARCLRSKLKQKEETIMKRSNLFKMLVLMGVWMVIFVSGVWAEEITIVGTGSGIAILDALGKAFTQLNPEVIITVPTSVGSSGGIKAVGRDEAVLGRVSREIKDNEKPYGLTYVPYAKNPVVFYVNKNVTAQTLSVQQVLDIYSGKITNWKDVGGSEMKIRVVVRQEGDSSLEVLLKLFPGFKDIMVTTMSKTTFTDQEATAAVEQTEGTIAYGAYGDAKAANVTIVNIGDQHPTQPDYPYVTTLAFIFKEPNYTGNLKKFVEFATSKDATEIIKNSGGIPLF